MALRPKALLSTRGSAVLVLAVLALLAGHSLGHSTNHAASTGVHASHHHHHGSAGAPASTGEHSTTPVHVAAIAAACGFALAMHTTTASRRTRRVKWFAWRPAFVAELFVAPEPPVPKGLLAA